MPQIKEYTQQVSAQADIPNQRGRTVQFGGPGLQHLGAAIVEAGGDIGRAGRALTEQKSRLEVTNAYASQAKIMADRTLDLETRAKQAAPGDETLADKFTEDVAKQLDAEDEKYETTLGKQAWTRAKAELAGHFVVKSGQMQSKLAGAKATQDFQSMVDSYQIVVNNDPSLFEATKNRLEESITDPNGMYSRILPEHRDAVKRAAFAQLANAAMEGIIRVSPELGKQMLSHPSEPSNNPAQDVTGEQLDALKSKADVGIERNHTVQERKYMAEKRAKQENNERVFEGLTRRIMDPKQPGGMPSDEEIAGAPFHGERAGEMIAQVDSFKYRRIQELAANSEDKKHPAEVHRLMNQLIADADDPTKMFNLDAVRAAYRNNEISTAEETFLEERFAKLKDGSTNTFEKDLNAMVGTATHVISNSIQYVGRPDAALEAVGRVRADVYARADRLRQENKDPRALLDPKSKEYFFSQENLSTYTVSPALMLKKGAEETKKAEVKAPEVGTVEKGYRFKGGDPRKQESWEPVSPGPGEAGAAVPPKQEPEKPPVTPPKPEPEKPLVPKELTDKLSAVEPSKGKKPVPLSYETMVKTLSPGLKKDLRDSIDMYRETVTRPSKSRKDSLAQVEAPQRLRSEIFQILTKMYGDNLNPDMLGIVADEMVDKIRADLKAGKIPSFR